MGESACQQFHSSCFDFTGINPRSKFHNQRRVRKHSEQHLQVAQLEPDYRRPPAMSSVSPVIQAESGDAKKNAAGAMSSVCPTRPSGVCDSNIFRMSPSV